MMGINSKMAKNTKESGDITFTPGHLDSVPEADVLLFLSQCTIEADGLNVGANDLFETWQRWYENKIKDMDKGSGIEYGNRIGRSIFNNNVAACGYVNDCIDINQVALDGEDAIKLVSVWKGIKLVEQADLEAEIRVFAPLNDWRSDMLNDLCEHAEGVVPSGKINELINVYSTHSGIACEVDDKCLEIAMSLIHLQGEVNGMIIDWDKLQNQFVIRQSHYTGDDLIEKINEARVPSEGFTSNSNQGNTRSI